ncbi:hypothetical protein RHMOL_Rhmol08G0251200 [Rhododendron molle]|uniref:Uncharacterized protein n=1 Tax=Rhododendron molle TaxID=49168 RepID=A0ACC0MTH7_RHOML|nr:hypothetical protein RHMOL_Rhmol08G0251200 [Rhododendron molle]
MINKQRNKNRELGSKNQPLFILFIDNLSKGVDQGWLRKTFNNYGVVKDAFIPSCKRSKRTGSKFGFVRYDCHVSAGVTISTSNGLWVSDKKLFVKEASFGRYMTKSALKVPMFHRPDVGTSLQGIRGNHGTHFDIGKSGHKSFNQGISFAQMVSGEINIGGRVEKESEKGLKVVIKCVEGYL